MTIVATDIENIDKELREAVAEFRRDMGALRKQRADLEHEWTSAVDERAATDILQKIHGTTEA
ncbi:MAG: hypothetical protein WBO92_01975 [Candidatus Moraniibacteriota bacterium]|nr:MAG: hypothetical protein IPJ68_00390 [Candidatus Moranbacteria bacterium]